VTDLTAARTILIFGAGNIGLSFIGQIFARSGYRVVFADIDSRITSRLNRFGGYSVRHVGPSGEDEDIRIEPVETIDAGDRTAVGEVLQQKPLIATAVGARAFPIALRQIADSATGTGRVDLLPSLDIIVAENLRDPAALAEETLETELPGIHACSVGKMVPLQDRDPAGELVVRAEPFNTLVVDGTDWRGETPKDVRWVRLVEDIHAWMDSKMFIHNLGHSACAWRSRAASPGVARIADTLEDPRVFHHVRTVMLAMARIVGAEYEDAFSSVDLAAHVEDLLHRFSNRELGDTVERVGRDLTRKLGRDERVIGSMRLAAKYADRRPGTHDGPDALQVLAAVAQDASRFGLDGLASLPSDVALSVEAARDGIGTVIARTAGLDARDPVDRRILDALEGAGVDEDR